MDPREEDHVVEDRVCVYFIFLQICLGAGLIDWTDWGAESNQLGVDLLPTLKSPGLANSGFWV